MPESASKSRWLQRMEYLPCVIFFRDFISFIRLFQSAHLSQFTETPECRRSLDKMLEEAFLLSDELFDLQEVAPPFPIRGLCPKLDHRN